MSMDLKVASTNHVTMRNLRRLDTDTAPSTYDSLTCRVLLAEDRTEVVAAITMTQVSNVPTAYECYIPATASLVAGTEYIVQCSVTLDTDKARVFEERVTATTD